MELIELKNQYLRNIIGLFEKIKNEELESFVQKILSFQGKSGTIFFIGNGGSSLNATHFAMGITIVSRKWSNPIRATALTDSAMITSVANDYCFEDACAKLVSVYAKSGDMLVVISTSGNSKNLVNAACEARKLGIETFGLLGGDGGELLSICDKTLFVPTDEKDPGYIEDVHIILGHIITSYIQKYK